MTKRYGDVVGVEDVSFAVGEGEIVGLVGPNGAGKTTILECLSGLRRPDAGSVSVFGVDPAVDRAEVARLLGVQLQEAQLPERLRVAEAVRLYEGFYERPADGYALLEEFGLAGSRRRAFAELSGGQRQRLAIVLALIGSPRAVVLDELTTGLDPQARRATWEWVVSLRERGLTVVLSTHYMEEAERLCHRVGVLVGGRLVALDAPGRIAEETGRRHRVVVDLTGPIDAATEAALARFGNVSASGGQLVIDAEEGSVARVVRALERSAISYRSLRVHSATLEEAYLALTSSDPGAMVVKS